MSILIVDDNKVNLFVIEKILKNEGYTDFISFTSATELFQYLKLDSPSSQIDADVILMDIMMPGIDGIQACKILQETPHLRDIPVIFVTALEDSEKVAEALDVGAIDYITKPIKKVELLARLRVALRLKYEKDWHTQQEKKIRDELRLATEVQRNLLSSPISTPNLQIASSYLPAFQLAGDMYYWQKLDNERYGVMILDMMGHGISSSLVCMYISSVLRDAMKHYTEPEEVIRELNNWMHQLYNEENEMNYYFTAIYLVIDTKKKTVDYINAGHPPGFALIDGSQTELLKRSCCAVGFFEEIDMKKHSLSYRESIQILMYTDGVLEAIENEGIDGLHFLKAASEHIDDPQLMTNPLDFILTEELQKNHPDDMCVVVIKAS
ncbi:SpoIIE family protein phosphatase [Bacillus lacus]|uniref:SpoIIE family protein phosphatase n=1 Tax=Metabacillus lacus TaxID=1983721 RepID=A0A7X2IX63_9BACI|nr:fused response regulator/phosphatase [Metabacillus lacus]MRX70783.1 SpoIIE family protein phosphatase [Metabacillus lacus]